MRHFSSCCLISLALLQPLYPIAPAPTPTSLLNDASAVTSAASPTLLSSPASPKDWKIGVQMWTFHFVNFVKALDKCDSAGIKYIEAFPGQTLGGDLPGSFGPAMSGDTRAKVKQLLQSKGIHIYAMGNDRAPHDR